jgi:tRNA (guanine-N7-)-methyltransferase
MIAAARPLRSFGRRRSRRIRGLRSDLIHTRLPQHAIALPKDVEDPADWFGGRAKDVWLEIGFGAGEHLAAQAERHPQIGFIGCEPYVNGVGSLLIEMERRSLSNIRVFGDDVRLLLPHLRDHSIGRIFILFPDPWPKTRHHKRRLICEATLVSLARVLKKGGMLRLATDHSDYAAWILRHALACDNFEWTAERCADWRNPPADWVPTRYEQKNASGGSPAYLDFIRC